MSQTRLSDFTFTFHFHALEKEMAAHSSVFAWRIPGTGESGGLPSMGLHRVRHDWHDLEAAAAAVDIRFASQAKGPSLKLDGKSMHILGFPGGSGVRNLAAMQEMQEIWVFVFFFICGGFCYTLKWNSQGFTCVPHPNPPSHLPLHPFPLGFPSLITLYAEQKKKKKDTDL